MFRSGYAQFDVRFWEKVSGFVGLSLVRMPILVLNIGKRSFFIALHCIVVYLFA